MGTGPNGCPNEYYANFTSFTVDNGSQNIDLMANPGVTFTALVSEGYNVSFVLHTAANSSQGNTGNGSVRLETTTLGYIMGACVGQEVNGTWLWGFNQNNGNGSVHPNENLPMGWNVQIAYSYYPSLNGDSYYWLTDGPNVSYVYYNVIWIEQTSTALSCQTEQNGTVNCISTVTGIQPGSPPFGAPNGTVNFTTSSSTSGYCTLANLNSTNYDSDSSSCSFSFTPVNPGTVNIRASYSGDYDQAPSSNSTTINCCVQTTTSTTSSTSSSSTQSTSSDPSQTTTTSSSDPTSSSHSTTSLRSTSSDNTDSTQPSTHSTFQTTASSSNLGTGGLNYTESMAALVIVAVVITGMMFVTIRKSW